MSSARRAALGWLVVASWGAGCDLAALDDSRDDPVIPADHPCPELALAPRTASLWEAHRTTGEVVPLALTLPLPADSPAAVSQGNDQLPTHRDDDRWAWDFAVPEGTLVHAAAPGTVVVVRDDSTRWGRDPSYRADANFVVVDHGGGLFSSYVHLAAGSALVSPGQWVEAAEVVAATGLSGLMTGPHLHFQLENTWSASLPARFADPPATACDLAPQTGDIIEADSEIAATLVGRDELSELPTNTFRDWGVTSLQGLPGRLLDRRAPYRVTGAVAPEATDLYLLLVPPEGGTAIAFWQLPVSDGRFAGSVSLSAVPAGSYGFGAVAVGPLDEVAIERTVRISVR